jgi:hypothetical protein
LQRPMFRKAQRRKPKVSIGTFSNYQFDKTKFLQDMKSIPSGTPVSWTELARKYQVRNAQGNAPGNAGQVLFQFARQNGIDVFQCNRNQRISGRDYFRRVRRPKQHAHLPSAEGFFTPKIGPVPPKL